MVQGWKHLFDMEININTKHSDTVGNNLSSIQ